MFGYDVVRSLLGIVLIAASVAKGYELANGAGTSGNLSLPGGFLGAMIGVELLFGLWLLSGAYPKTTWSLTLLAFASLLAISIYQGAVGKPTCGCFGKVPISPWYVAAFDLAAVLALVIWRPKTVSGAYGLSAFVPYLASAVVLLALLIGWAFWQFGSIPVAVAYLTGERVIVHPSTVTVGEGRLGERREATVMLTNLSSRTITVLGAKPT